VATQVKFSSLKMNSSDLIPILAMLLYSTQGFILLHKRQYGFALMWFSYAVANIGILIAQRK